MVIAATKAPRLPERLPWEPSVPLTEEERAEVVAQAVLAAVLSKLPALVAAQLQTQAPALAAQGVKSLNLGEKLEAQKREVRGEAETLLRALLPTEFAALAADQETRFKSLVDARDHDIGDRVRTALRKEGGVSSAVAVLLEAHSKEVKESNDALARKIEEFQVKFTDEVNGVKALFRRELDGVKAYAETVGTRSVSECEGRLEKRLGDITLAHTAIASQMIEAVRAIQPAMVNVPENAIQVNQLPASFVVPDGSFKLHLDQPPATVNFTVPASAIKIDLPTQRVQVEQAPRTVVKSILYGPNGRPSAIVEHESVPEETPVKEDQVGD